MINYQFVLFQSPLTEKMSYGSGQKVQKVMVQPINLIFRYLQNRTRVSVWLYENVNTRYCPVWSLTTLDAMVQSAGLRVTSRDLMST